MECHLRTNKLYGAHVFELIRCYRSEFWWGGDAKHGLHIPGQGGWLKYRSEAAGRDKSWQKWDQKTISLVLVRLTKIFWSARLSTVDERLRNAYWNVLYGRRGVQWAWCHQYICVLSILVSGRWQAPTRSSADADKRARRVYTGYGF